MTIPPLEPKSDNSLPEGSSLRKKSCVFRVFEKIFSFSSLFSNINSSLRGKKLDVQNQSGKTSSFFQKIFGMGFSKETAPSYSAPNYSEGVYKPEKAQQIFKKLSKSAIDAIVEKMKSGIEDLDQILSFSAERRKEIQEQQDNAQCDTGNLDSLLGKEELVKFQDTLNELDPEPLSTAPQLNQFGKKREDSVSLITPLGAQYKSYGDFLKSRMKNLIKGKTASELGEGFTVSEEVKGSFGLVKVDIHVQYFSEIKVNENQVRKWVFEVSIGEPFDSRIQASRYILLDENSNAGLNADLQIEHQSVDEGKKMDPHIRKLFKECLKKGIKKEELIEKVAIFRWALTHRTYFERGSASIAEWIEKAIYQYHGYDFKYGMPNQSQGQFCADLDAFCYLYLDDYLKTYKNKAIL